MSDLLVIQSTTGTRHDAQQIAAALIEQRVAACVQISGPIESVYRWDGQQQTSEEWLLTIKTAAEKFADVERVILSLHPYDQPEIVAMPVVAANAGYAKWVRESL